MRFKSIPTFSRTPAMSCEQEDGNTDNGFDDNNMILITGRKDEDKEDEFH